MYPIIGSGSQTLHAKDIGETTYALPEKTKRGPPTNKNIPVRNMKAQISNMCLNENNGFKSEYHVRFFVLLFLYILNCYQWCYVGVKIYM